MNTNTLKSFAKQARIILLEAVGRQLLYWGFTEKGEITAKPEKTSGGFSFRGRLYNETATLDKWNRLRDKVENSKQGFLDVAEEAAYTWFNRLMAIKILEENQFIEPVLRFVENTTIPMILQNAKAGNHNITHSGIQAMLQDALLNDEDDKALGILLINYCNKHPLLQKVFGKLNDYTELLVPQNLLVAGGFLEELNDTNNIETEDYQHVELIGWLYQFYISDRKDEVFKGFKKKKKARAEDIPAATQIFTPRWIVDYMVENTVGKIYLDYEEDSELKNEMKYLVASTSHSHQEDNGRAESRPNLISDISELTLIDPACGSGHILVRGFEWLYKMYREQGYNPQQAVEYILKKNLYGLDIDDRAMQLARFAVLLKASQKLKTDFPGRGKALIENPHDLIPHIYAFPESRNIVTEEIKQFTDNSNVAQINKAFEELQQGKNLGSALKLELSEEAIEVLKIQYHHWKNKAQLDIEELGIWQKLKDYVEVALTLSQQYTAVVANPPYMGQKNMNADLKKYVNRYYKDTKSDLMTVFMEVIPNLTKDNFRFALINLPSWLFLSSFEKLRDHYLENYQFSSLLHMGRGIFGIDFGSVAFTIQKSKNPDAKGNYFRLHERNFQHIYFEDIKKLFLYSKGNPEYRYDFKLYRDENGVNEIFEQGHQNGQKLFYPNIPQSNFKKIPGSPIAYWVSEDIANLFNENKSAKDNYEIFEGLKTGDNKRFIKLWFEINKKDFSNYAGKKFFPHSKGGGYRKWYGNNLDVLFYEDDGLLLRNFKRASLTKSEFYFEPYLSWSRITANKPSFRFTPKGFIPNMAGLPAFFKDNSFSYYLMTFGNTKPGEFLLKLLNPTLNFPPGVISKSPLPEVSESKAVVIEKLSSKNIRLSQKDWDSRETSWDFEENPLLSQKASSLKEAYQQWKSDVSEDFFQLHQNEEELNRIFIDIYGLQEELSPEVALKDITILQDEVRNKDLEELEEEFRATGTIDLPIQQDVVIQQFLSYLIGLMLGRYRLDKPGLHIAHPNPSEEEIAAYQVDNVAEPFSFEIEKDAILPMMGEDSAFANDAARRIKDIVYHIWGDGTHSQNLNFIEASIGMNIEKWVSEKFWPYHFSGTMYKKKPIYWLFASNPKSPHRAAFKVLVYMHRMNAFTVQKILRDYLYPQQQHLMMTVRDYQSKEAMLSKEESKQFEILREQLRELKEYEQELKAYANKQITFDLDDGVDENIKLFEGIVAKVR